MEIDNEDMFEKKSNPNKPKSVGFNKYEIKNNVLEDYNEIYSEYNNEINQYMNVMNNVLVNNTMNVEYNSINEHLSAKDMGILWRNLFKTGEVAKSKHLINRINHKEENILGFLFKSIINKANRNFEYNKNFNLHELLESLTEIKISAQGNQPLIIGLNNYALLKKELKLDISHWNKIIDITNKDKINEYVPIILKNILRTNKYSINERQEIINNILAPIIEKSILTKENNTKILFSLVDVGFKEGINLHYNLLGKLIEDSNTVLSGSSKDLLNDILDKHNLWVKSQLRYDYMHFINRDNFKKIVDKTAPNTVINTKELMVNYDTTKMNGLDKNLYKLNRNVIINRFIKTDVDKLVLYMDTQNERVFSKDSREKDYTDILDVTGFLSPSNNFDEKMNTPAIFADTIDEVVNRISQSSEDSMKVLEIWIDKRFIKDIKNNHKNAELTNDHIDTLVRAIDYKKSKNQINIASLLLKKLEESDIVLTNSYMPPFITYEKKIKLPYFKELLNKNKEIPGKNGFLTKYYLNENFNNILNITEEEFKSYIDVKAANRANKYQDNFLNDCINKNLSNYKRTQTLVSFAIDMVNLNNDSSKDVITNLMQLVISAKNDAHIYDLKNRISKDNIIKLINKEKLFGDLALNVLFSISKIEEVWGVKIDKENIFNNIDFNNIDFNNIDFKYEKRIDPVKDIYTRLYAKYSFGNKQPEDLINVEDITVWLEMLIQKNKKGEKAFTKEDIKTAISKVDFTSPWKRRDFIASVFEKDTTFIKFLAVEEPVFFETIMNSIIENSIKNKNKIKEKQEGMTVRERLKKGYNSDNSSDSYYMEYTTKTSNYLEKSKKENNEEQESLETIFLTDLTKKLLKLKESVEFKDEIVLKSYDESNREKITKEEIYKAGLALLMKEEDLNNIEVAYNLVKKNKENFYNLGKQLIEFLQIDIENGEKVLSEYSENNTKGILKIFKRKEKEKLQSKINEALLYAEKQQVNIVEIKEEIEKINKKNFNKEEKDKINEVITKLEEINKEDLKGLSITENADLKRCMENSYIKVIKNYSKLTMTDKEESPDLREDFHSIMNYCIKEIDNKFNKSTINRKYNRINNENRRTTF